MRRLAGYGDERLIVINMAGDTQQDHRDPQDNPSR